MSSQMKRQRENIKAGVVDRKQKAQSKSRARILPEEDDVGADAEHHGDDTVAHQAEVPPPAAPLPLLCSLLCVRLMELLPVSHVVPVIHADGKEVERGSRQVTRGKVTQVAERVKTDFTEALMRDKH